MARNYENRRALSHAELVELASNSFIEITEEQAVCSDIGGDSDAEDVLPLSAPYSHRDVVETRQNRRNKAGPSTSKDQNSESSGSDYLPSDADDKDDAVSVMDVSEGSDNGLDTSSDTDTSANIDIKWTKQARDPKMYNNCVFQQPFGCKMNLNRYLSPLEYFMLFFTQDFMQEIIKQSNLYGQQKNVELGLDLLEFRAWLGIIIFMGFHSLPSLRLYWSTDENFHCERVARVMSVKRFLCILRLLHIADNSKMPERGTPKFDRLYKVRPLLDHLSQKFSEAFSPSRNISIDESMVAFKGRTTMKQYMPLKPIKRGFKVWAMCCAATGYMIAFEVYTGKNPEGTITKNLGESVVLRLSQFLEGMWYCLFFDNFFTTVPLLLQLLKKKLFGCGTFRQNRKYFPSNHLKSNKNMKRLEMDYAMSEDLSASKWLDRGKTPVCVLSSMHNPSDNASVLRRNTKGVREEVPCPPSIATYNKFMGGVDRLDQHLAVYSVAQKSRRWWIKLFYYFLDCSIVNSYIMYKENMKKQNLKYKTHLQFRSVLVNDLIANFSSKKRPGYFPMKGFAKKRNSSTGQATVSNTTRLVNVGSHLPEKISTYRRCANCSTKKKEKRSNLVCKMCNVALCKDCFAVFHTSK